MQSKARAGAPRLRPVGPVFLARADLEGKTVTKPKPKGDLRERLMNVWEEVCDDRDLGRHAAHAAFCGAAKDLLFEVGMVWDEEGECYVLREP